MTSKKLTVSLILGVVLVAFAFGVYNYQRRVQNSQMEKVTAQQARLVRMHSTVFGPQAAGPQRRRQRLVIRLGGMTWAIPLEQACMRGGAEAVLPDLHIHAGGRTELCSSPAHAGRIHAG